MKKLMPVGVSDFKKLRESNYYFVDKTFFIKDIIDNKSEVMLFARPRRFGKTIIMSMIKYYFSLEDNESNKNLFFGLQIANAENKYIEEQGKYPVIFLTMKDIKLSNWSECYDKLCSMMSDEYSRLSYILDSDALQKDEKSFFLNIINKTAVYEQEIINQLSKRC